MNLNTGEIVMIKDDAELAELERVALEEKMAKIEMALLDTKDEIAQHQNSEDPDEATKEFLDAISGNSNTVNYREIERLPKSGCRKCYGRGFIGRDIAKNQYVPCSCVRAK